MEPIGWHRIRREEITKRYLKYRRDLAKEALARLVDEESPDPDVVQVIHNSEEEAVEQKLNLNEQRLNAVIAALKSANAKRVLDLGCGEGKLLRVLLEDRSFDEIVGVDVSHRTLQVAHDRLRRTVTIREENSIAALEVMSRFATDPKWLIYLPPTMSPSETSREPGLLEHPAEAFSYYRYQGVAQVICRRSRMRVWCARPRE